MIKDLHACLRCTGREAYCLACKYAGHGTVGHTVYVFSRVKGILNLSLVQVLRKRTEQQNAVNAVVLIYLIYSCQNLLRKQNLLTCYAQSLTSLGCASLIGNIALVLAYADNSQCGVYSLCLQSLYVCLDTLIQCCCYFFS